jgi:hypothetical protein
MPAAAAPARASARPLAAAGAVLGDAFLEAVRRFTGFGTPTRAAEQDGLPYLVNAFWTAGQRQAHAIHELSYRACFKPQLPGFFIAGLTQQGEAVLDPFMGRGTTPIEAALRGRRPVGNDVNPLSVLLTRPRLAPPAIEAVARHLQAVPWDRPVELREDLLAFYHPETLRGLSALRAWLLAEAPLAEGAPDPVLDWIRMVAINRLAGHSPGFFSVYTLPPNQAASVARQLRINAQRHQAPPPRDIAAIILKKSRQLLRGGAPPPHPPATLMTGNAVHMPQLADASIALAVTSPPFLDIVQYADDNWLRCWFAGIDVQRVAIARHRGEPAWEEMVREALCELARVVRPGGHVAFEVGEVRGGQVLLERLVWRAVEGLPFARLAVLVNQQHFTKTANCWGVANNAKGTNTNRIVLLRRV